MSNKISSTIQTKKVGSPTKKAILMYMADKASDDGTGIWVSKPNMAADLEMTDRAVRKHIKEMVDMGIIGEAGQRKCRYGYTIDYAINMKAILLLESTRSTHEPHSPLNDIHPHPCTTFRGTPEPRSGKPSLEPSIEPNISSEDDFEFRFNLLYNDYPRKIGKGAARNALKTALKKTDYENLFSKVIDFSIAMEGKDPKYIPHMATWLNQERWEDEQ